MWSTEGEKKFLQSTLSFFSIHDHLHFGLGDIGDSARRSATPTSVECSRALGYKHRSNLIHPPQQH